jgi:acyl-CoA thioesterase-1
MYKRFIYPLFIIITYLFPAPAIIQAAEYDNSSAVILVLGDSLSAAYGISQNESWVDLLQKRLAQKHYSYKVVNASITGETTSGGLSRLDHALATHIPDIVILELGANDGLRGLPITQMQHNLSAIIIRIEKANARVLLVGMQIPTNYGFNYTQKFRDSYKILAENYKLELVPFLLEGVATKRALLQSDGLHPRAEAQPVLLDNVWPYLKRLITK